jgi:hypothetical protein
MGFGGDFGGDFGGMGFGGSVKSTSTVTKTVNGTKVEIKTEKTKLPDGTWEVKETRKEGGRVTTKNYVEDSSGKNQIGY